MKILKKASILFLSCFLTLSFFSKVQAAEIVKSNAVADLPKTSVQEESITGMMQDPNAAQGNSETLKGYTKADAEAIAQDLYGFVDDTKQKNMYIQSIVNSTFYDPANCYVEADGTKALILYRGVQDDFSSAYSFIQEGITFFSNPVLVFGQQDGALLLAVETDAAFDADRAADNMRILQKIRDTMHSVRDAVSQKDNTGKAAYICDYIADSLTYDSEKKKNSLADAIDTGVTACMGYNAEALLFFGNCGIPYRSVTAKSKADGRGHILGLAMPAKAWLFFDTTNYDQDYGKEPYWIFSDTYRESQFYSDLTLLRQLPEN